MNKLLAPKILVMVKAKGFYTFLFFLTVMMHHFLLLPKVRLMFLCFRGEWFDIVTFI